MIGVSDALQADGSTSPFGFGPGAPSTNDSSALPIGWVTRAGVASDGTIGEPNEDADVTVQINCAGLDAPQAEGLLNLARQVVMDLPYQASPITGRNIYQVEVAGGTTIQSPDPLPGRYLAVELYSIHTTPT